MSQKLKKGQQPERDKDAKKSARRDRSHFTKQPAEEAKTATKGKDMRTVHTKCHYIGRRRDIKQEQAGFRKARYWSSQVCEQNSVCCICRL